MNRRGLGCDMDSGMYQEFSATEFVDMFPQTSDIWLKIHRYVPIWRHQSARIEPHRERSSVD